MPKEANASLEKARQVVNLTEKVNFPYSRLAGGNAFQRFLNTALRQTLACGEIPDRAALVEMMKTARLFHVESDSTYARRAATIRAWIRWIVSLFLE